MGSRPASSARPASAGAALRLRAAWGCKCETPPPPAPPSLSSDPPARTRVRVGLHPAPPLSDCGATPLLLCGSTLPSLERAGRHLNDSSFLTLRDRPDAGLAVVGSAEEGAADVLLAAGGATLTRLGDGAVLPPVADLQGELSTLEASPCGRLVALGHAGRDADVIVRDASTLELLFRVHEHDHRVSALAFSPDSRLLASCGSKEDGKVIVWDCKTGCMVCCNKQVGEGNIAQVAWGFTGKTYVLATAGESGLTVWNVDPYNGSLLPTQTLEGYLRRDFNSVIFSKRGDAIFAGSTSGDIAMYGLPGRNLVGTHPICPGGVRHLIETDDGRVLVGGGDGGVHVFDPSRPQARFMPTAELDGPVVRMTLDRSSKTMYSVSGHCTVYKTDLVKGKSSVIMHCHASSITAAVCHNVDPRYAVTCGKDNTVRMWSLENAQVVNSICLRGAGGALCAAFLGDDEKVVTGWGDGSIRCFNMSSSSKDEIWGIKNAHLTPVTALSIAKSGKFFLSGDEDGVVCVWDIRCREMVVQMKQHGSTVTGIAITEDDSVAVTSSKDKTFMSWDLHSHRRITCHTQRMGAINGVLLAKDQVQVVTVGNDRKLSFWDLREPQPLQVIDDAHDQPSSCVGMSSDGSLVASGGNDNAVRLWDFNSGYLIAEGAKHCGGVTSVSFSADNRRVISSDSNGCLMLWDVAS